MTFSVVIPSHGRALALQRCLRALQALGQAELEIVVVDDGTEPPLTVPGGVHLFRQLRSGPAAARNLGAQMARGDWLVFMDDDCEPGPGWWPNLVQATADHPNTALGGHTRNRLTQNVYAEASQALVDFLYDFQERRPSASQFFTSNNLVVPRADFLKLNGFDTSFRAAAGEDREFLLRWTTSGRPTRWMKSLVVLHAHNLNLLRFCRQHFRYGQAARHYWRRCGTAVKVEKAGFYLRLMAWPWRRGPSYGALIQSFLFALSQVANGVGYFAAGQES